ncbi:MAG: glycosyltransferase family 39 protein [Planctomycetota bacterium]
MPWLRHLVGDAAGYWEWAQRIAGGDWIGGESFYQAPLYPYALAVLFTVFGEAVWIVRLAQSCAGVVGAGLICFTAWRLFGTRVGAVAGVMLGLYAPAVFFDGIIQKTSMGSVLTCGLLACLAWSGMGGRVLPVGVLGVVSGALVLTRENALV